MHEAEISPYIYFATLDRIVDGDTIKVTLDLGFEISLQKTLRLANIDCPEIRGKNKQKGFAAKKFVEQQIVDAPLLIRSEKVDGFGRAIAVVYFQKGDRWLNLNEAIVEAGYGIIKHY